MSAAELSAASSGYRRNTIVNLKHVNELPLRNALECFDKNGDGKIDITELQKIVYWYGLWKYASIGLCMVILVLVWSTFGLTIWAINLTKEYTVTDGVLTGNEEVVKMSVASTLIPLNWASLLDRRHLDSLEGVTFKVEQGSGKFTAGVYHMKVASYLHANSTYLKLFGADGSRVWINSGTVVLHHPHADDAIMVCGAAACNTLAIDVKQDYLIELVKRAVMLFVDNQGYELPTAVDGVAINKAEAKGATCQAAYKLEGGHGHMVTGSQVDKAVNYLLSEGLVMGGGILGLNAFFLQIVQHLGHYIPIFADHFKTIEY